MPFLKSSVRITIFNTAFSVISIIFSLIALLILRIYTSVPGTLFNLKFDVELYNRMGILFLIFSPLAFILSIIALILASKGKSRVQIWLAIVALLVSCIPLSLELLWVVFLLEVGRGGLE
ncbi:hypothetical protein [Tengunoibacter tsumagoiensis]|uniref:Uncharacterized protein n=1 Tax=Tengunoibacter tsumagoiensis TaxID=2014871 RepID=A0A401ZVM8_9CHLR|nr:hypothetical protein [Tengunoibacter tsumagoiensis]GCE10951.1 hypothetical protein KTT_08100 [Tengunoibacter tsumagoiensis]